MPGIASLPLEIFDEILKRLCTCSRRRRDDRLMHVVDRNCKTCATLRQVNKAFYYSATRVKFRSFAIWLQREDPDCHFPFLKFEELCRNANARYVERLVIRGCDKLSSVEAAQNLGEFAVSCKQFALRLEQFPSLRSIVLAFFVYPYGSNGMIAGDQIEQIIDALRLAQLPKLKRLRIFYDAKSEFTSEDGLHESPPSNAPSISWGIKNLQSVTLYLGFSRVTRKQDSSIRQILEHGEDLKYVDAHGIHILPRSSPTFLHPSAPLLFLRLAFTFLPGECLLELRHFKDTLRDLDLDDVRLTSRSWAEFFILLRQFSALRRGHIENCGYQNSGRYLSMTESDEQALLQYKSHRPNTPGSLIRRRGPLCPSQSMDCPFW